MKALRLCLLLLLAVLLPLRGALAAAPCAGEGLPAEAGHAHHHHHHHPLPLVAADGARAPAHAAGPAHAHADAARCHLCASCWAPPLQPTFSPAVVPLEDAPASFAVTQATAPIFLSDGQERPPRSL